MSLRFIRATRRQLKTVFIMAAKKRGLGRGLDALLGSQARADQPTDDKAPARTDSTPALKAVPDSTTAETVDGTLTRLPVDIIQRGKYQPRVDMRKDTLDELAASIREQGVLQPIVVRPVGKKKYEIIAGERRWRAAQLAGLHEIPAIVRAVDDRAAVAIALIENIQRENLNPMEEAQALQRLIDEFDITHAEAAEAVGRSRASVSNLLRLLELEAGVRELVEQGALEMGHARALLALPGSKQLDAARKVQHRGLSVRATEGLVRQLQRAQKARTASAPARDPDVLQLENELSDKLGASVQVASGRGGKGKLVINYNSLDELDGILAHIR